MSAASRIAEARTREFGGSASHVYLNAASYGPLPRRTRAAIDAFDARRSAAELDDGDLISALRAARAAAARLIAADPAEIALTPNTNVGLNLAAHAATHDPHGRRVVVIHDREFPANVYPWLALERRGLARVEIVPADAHGRPQEAALIARIEQGDVAAASISFVQFASGHRADLAAVGAACRRHDTLFAVDAIQGLGALPLAVDPAGVDVLACGGQKWLCSPWGSGFTYVRRALIDRIEPLQPGWFSFEASQEFTRLLDYRYELLADARRFETGSLAFQDYLGMTHSIELLLELDIACVWQHIRALQQPVLAWAAGRGIEIVSDLCEPRRSGILCVRPPDARAVHAQLARNQVRCAFREGSIRLSPHWYNQVADVERVVDIMESCLGR